MWVKSLTLCINLWSENSTVPVPKVINEHNYCIAETEDIQTRASPNPCKDHYHSNIYYIIYNKGYIDLIEQL